MFIVPIIDDKDKPGFLVGRVLRTDTNNVLDYDQVPLAQTDKDGKDVPEAKIRSEFEKRMKTKADGYLAKINGAKRGAPVTAN